MVLWGVLGFAALLAHALWELFPLAAQPLRDHSLTSVQIALYVLWVAFMAYTEGYKGFQRQLAPRLVARGFYAARHRRALWTALAPFFCMGLFHATRRRLIISWTIVIGVVMVVIAVRHLAQPWRGIIDGGVVVGLSWGLVAILWTLARAFLTEPPAVSMDIPQES